MKADPASGMDSGSYETASLMIQNSFEIIYSDEAQEDLLETVKGYNKQKKRFRNMRYIMK